MAVLRASVALGICGIGLKSANLGFFCSFSAAVSLTSGSSEGSKNSHWNHSICTVTEVSDVLVERYCSYLQDF